MKYESRTQQRHVTETMTSLLAPIMYHLNYQAKSCAEIALRILRETEIEEEDAESEGK